MANELSTVEDEELSPSESRGARFEQLIGQRQQRHGRYVQSNTNLLRARGQLIQEEVASQRFDLQHEELNLKRVMALSQLIKQRSVIQQQMETQRHVVGALQDIGKLDSSSPDYHAQVAEVFMRNPLAARDPMIQDIVRSQIASRHVMETSAAAIQQHEEAQASEFARIHGVDPVRTDAGRIDWTASQKSADDARDQRWALELGNMDRSMRPTETVIKSDGTVVQTFKAPDTNKLDESTSKIGELQTRAKETQRYLDAEPDESKQDTLRKSLAKINTALQGATIHHDELQKAIGPVVPAAAVDVQATPQGATPSGASVDVPTIGNADDFNALSSGSHFIDPDGIRRIKP